ncbi:non-ribosomal peptide synthetase, partial [Nostoc sp.]
KAFCTGIISVLPSLPVQYADFALWQRQWLPGEILEAQLDYWKQQLNDAPALLELPTDRPRPANQTYRGRYHYAALSLELSGKLSALSKRTRVTLFMTLLAAFVTLLSRITSSDDIVVGTPVAGRNRREIEGLIGFFVNTLVLRTHLGGDPSFEDVLSRVREVALGAYTHQDLPFEQLVEALQPKRDLSYTPLFQVMFALDEKSVPSFELPELTVSSYAVEIGTAKFDLTLSMENTASGLVGLWEYNVDLFDETTIARMVGHFQTLLEGIVANPQQKISSLPLLSKAERYQLLVEWNNTTKEYPQDKCIHQLFEEQVERTPYAVAVEFEDKQLTYREMNQRANKIAHHLKTLGVRPEVLVGICVERSPLMVVGLLGILKAGGAYVPLDPAYPAERLAYMLSDSQVKVLLTQEKLANSLPVSTAQVIKLDSDWQNSGKHCEENPLTEVKPSNLAYVIYTSGSTGKPKGVMIEHRSIVNFTSSAIAIYNITQSDRVLQFASIAFDGAAIEIFPCLSAGATLVLRTDEMLVSGSRFVQRCRECKVTMMDWPTSHWHQVMVELAAAEQTLPESLRVVSVGGDAVLPETLKLWQRCVKGLANPPQLLNGYGPTETTAVATYYDLSEFIAKNPATSCVPIGTPIGNLTTYILNHHLQPVPIGVPGELHIGGLGLARGYLGRPDLTAEKFIPNPFSNEPDARLYKTGDLVRYLSDGSIEFLGRIDNQVKIRGFRIELGEIEAVLTQHPKVDQAVVVVHEDQPANKRLVAYIVPGGALNFTEDLTHKIKADIRQQLPEYMVPATLMMLNALPLTPNGKVDRRALPPPDSVVRSLTVEMPQTKVEKIIADVWQKILLLEKVGLDDNFFDLGGTSLRLVQVWQKLQIIFTKKISMVEMFQHPTVRALGQLLSEQESQTPNAPKSEAERAELRNSSQGSMNQRRNIRQQYRSPKKQ